MSISYEAAGSTCQTRDVSDRGRRSPPGSTYPVGAVVEAAPAPGRVGVAHRLTVEAGLLPLIPVLAALVAGDLRSSYRRKKSSTVRIDKSPIITAAKKTGHFENANEFFSRFPANEFYPKELVLKSPLLPHGQRGKGRPDSTVIPRRQANKAPSAAAELAAGERKVSRAPAGSEHGAALPGSSRRPESAASIRRTKSPEAGESPPTSDFDGGVGGRSILEGVHAHVDSSAVSSGFGESAGEKRRR